MGKRKNTATASQMEAGKRNLERFLEQAAQPPALKHGVYSRATRKKFNDKRTKEGRALEHVMKALADDLGGEGSLNSLQRLILSGIRTKLVIMFLISGWLHENGHQLISEKGTMPEVVDRLRVFSESLAKDLKQLFGDKKAGDVTAVLA